jgi:hypothetical protein
MNNLAWALKVPLQIAALVTAAGGIYCFVRSGNALDSVHRAPHGPLMRLTVWVTRRMHGEEAARRRQQQLRKPSAIAAWACRVAFLSGALVAFGAILSVEVTSSGVYFPITWESSIALRRAINLLLPRSVMGYLSWRLGYSMARNVASAAPDAAREESRSHARTASVAIAFCAVTGANLMDGMLIVLRWIAFGIAKLGIV